ncbi:hypothetical protein RISK_003923 [Rhodopirellula islandica]|uniref:Uncharacterized protein n=1 Tax=Rhodopirellula islandica TaxID=595434 RepID=A0A0J1EEP2_RHOIS|nr:hypothetical protein RISK_003923 [Rhodopirellula islandica]
MTTHVSDAPQLKREVGPPQQSPARRATDKTQKGGTNLDQGDQVR